MRGADLQAEVPLERWDVEAGYSPSLAPQGGNIYVRFGAFCSGRKFWWVGGWVVRGIAAHACGPFGGKVITGHSHFQELSSASHLMHCRRGPG